MRSILSASVLGLLLAFPAFAGASSQATFAEADESCAVEPAAGLDCRLDVTATLSAWCETRPGVGVVCFVGAVGHVEITDASPARLASVDLGQGGSSTVTPCNAAGAPTTACAFDTYIGTPMALGTCLPVTLRVRYGANAALEQARVSQDYEMCRALDGTLTLE